MNFIKLLLIYNLFLVTIIGCSGVGTEPSNFTPAELTDQGWQNFSSANYQSALDKFEEAINKDDSFVEALSGAGWACARLLKLNNAVTYFSQGISQSSNLIDAYAGLAFVYHAQKQYSLAIASANNALTINAHWDFSHDTTLDYKDLHLIMAECYFTLLDFSNSLAQVKILNPSFSANVNTFEGRAALAAEIERLRNVV